MTAKNPLILVTGGAGFIGSHLTDLLIEKQYRVRVIDNFANGLRDNIRHHEGNDRFEFIEGDITDSAAVETAMKGVERVFHLACLGVRHSLIDPFRNHEVNARGSLNLLESARLEGVKHFLYCSSSEVYGTAQTTPMTELHPTHPCTVYGGSKLAGESYTRAYYKSYAMPTTVIRLFNTYGPRSHYERDAGEFIPKSVIRALNGKNILVFGDGLQTRDFTYVTDSARALFTASWNDDFIGKTLNVGNNKEITIKDLGERILNMLPDTGSQIEHLPGRPGDVLRLFSDPSVFVKATGWTPEVGFQEGLKRTIDYFQNHPKGFRNMLDEEVSQNWIACS